eukprot:2661780-Prymnesium_polylepis.1
MRTAPASALTLDKCLSACVCPTKAAVGCARRPRDRGGPQGLPASPHRSSCPRPPPASRHASRCARGGR